MKLTAVIPTFAICLGYGSTSIAQSAPSQNLNPAIISDYDDDGWNDAEDNCPARSNPTQKDGDGDTLGDVCDECDSTQDTSCENQSSDPLRELTLSDFVRNASRSDSDRDGYSNLADNCPALANLDQADRDDDKVGDACDSCPDAPAPGYMDGCVDAANE